VVVALTAKCFTGDDDENGTIWRDDDVTSLQEIRLDGMSKITYMSVGKTITQA